MLQIVTKIGQAFSNLTQYQLHHCVVTCGKTLLVLTYPPKARTTKIIWMEHTFSEKKTCNDLVFLCLFKGSKNLLSVLSCGVV